MIDPRWQRIRELYEQAADLPVGERSAFLDRECGDDGELRRKVEDLLVQLTVDEDDAPSSRGDPTVEIADDSAADLPDSGSGLGASEPARVAEAKDRRDRDALPRSIGPYRILDRLGEGGMGQVLLAEQTSPVRRRVALKLIKLGMDTREVVARFEAERQALALMDHPSIAKVYDAGATEDGRPYFVMEHVAGVPITEYCDRHRLSTKERLDLFVQVCEAVQHAHQKAIIHRDIKPSNVLVTEVDDRPVPKVIDFGIAKATNQRLTERTFFTQYGQIVGTPAYMSPEQAEGTVQDIDTRSDIYSLGVLLYELLVGSLPFDAASLLRAGYAEIQRVIREEDPPRPSTRVSGLDDQSSIAADRRRTRPRLLARELRGDLDWITMKALEKNRARRYATAVELAEDVRRFLNMDPVRAGPPSWTYRARKLARKHPGRIAAAVGVILVIAVVTGQARYHRHRVRQEALRQSRELRSRAGEHQDDFTREVALRDRLRTELREARERYEPWQPVWERPDETGTAERLRTTEERVDGLYNLVVSELLAARQRAPEGSDEQRQVREALARVFYSRYEEAREQGGVEFSPSFFETLVRSQEVDGYAERLDGAARLLVSSEPAGADVHCFRYESRSERLYPVPFDHRTGRETPAEGRVGAPHLRVERIWPPDADVPFRAGDRWQRVNGVDVATRADLAGALRDVEADQPVVVRLDREGRQISVSWVPWPVAASTRWEDPASPFGPGRVVDPRQQFGLTFEAYPLETLERNRIGRTSADEPVSVELPRGSYLLLVRRRGHLDARIPVTVPVRSPVLDVRLVPASAAPPGFLHVPAGDAYLGGDASSYQGLDGGRRPVGDFLMARREVTLDEYLEFLNDPEIGSRISDDGTAEPRIDWEDELLGGLRPRRDGEPVDEVRAQYVMPLGPSDGGTPRLLFLKDAGTGRWSRREGYSADLPVLGVSMFAAVEYADWRTRRQGAGARWRYRLPRDEEWEKAARGADRRFHVWGDTLVLSFCDSLLGSWGRQGKKCDPVEAFPFDESVYGIRDLAGSVSEPVLARATARLRFVVQRGGNWEATDPRDYRAATRNRKVPEAGYRFTGVRLVAVPADTD